MRKKVDFGDTIDIKQEAGSECEGKYLSFKEVDTNLGTSLIYKFEKKNGHAFSIWGFTSLDMYMENVGVGTYCWITYKGLSEKKNKYGKHTHMCLVEVDDETSCIPTKFPKPMAVAEVVDKFGNQSLDKPDDVPEQSEFKVLDFFEYMLMAKETLKKATGDHSFYNKELKDKFDIQFLSQVKGETVKQNEIRSYFEGLIEEVIQSET